MLENVIPNGYSSQVRGRVVISGVQYELAQVGPNFCILRDPLPADRLVTNEIQAHLHIEIDGDQREVAVLLGSADPSTPKKMYFRQI